jgi:hypothetical protein
MRLLSTSPVEYSSIFTKGCLRIDVKIGHGLDECVGVLSKFKTIRRFWSMFSDGVDCCKYSVFIVLQRNFQ